MTHSEKSSDVSNNLAHLTASFVWPDAMRALAPVASVAVSLLAGRTRRSPAASSSCDLSRAKKWAVVPKSSRVAAAGHLPRWRVRVVSGCYDARRVAVGTKVNAAERQAWKGTDPETALCRVRALQGNPPPPPPGKG